MDKTTYARHGSESVFRLDRSGKWYVQRVGWPKRPVSVGDAARYAVEMERAGGILSLGLAGGRIFDRKVAEVRAQV